MKDMVLVNKENLRSVLALFSNGQSLREQITIANLDAQTHSANSCITQLINSLVAVEATPKPQYDVGISTFTGFYKLPELKQNQLYMCHVKGCDDIQPIFIEENNKVVYDGCAEDPNTKVLAREYSMAQVCNHCHGELRIYDESVGDVVSGSYQHFAAVPPATATE